MKEKIKTYSLEILTFIIKKILLFDLVLCVIVALSFFLFGKFSLPAYSERLIWSGIGVALIAGVLMSSQTVGGRSFGTANTYSSAYSQSLIEFNIEVRQAIENKLGYLPRMFFIGAVLFGIGALFQVLFG